MEEVTVGLPTEEDYGATHRILVVVCIARTVRRVTSKYHHLQYSLVFPT